jgi:hypothetical protein
MFALKTMLKRHHLMRQRLFCDPSQVPKLQAAWVNRLILPKATDQKVAWERRCGHAAGSVMFGPVVA